MSVYDTTTVTVSDTRAGNQAFGNDLLVGRILLSKSDALYMAYISLYVTALAKCRLKPMRVSANYVLAFNLRFVWPQPCMGLRWLASTLMSELKFERKSVQVLNHRLSYHQLLNEAQVIHEFRGQNLH